MFFCSSKLGYSQTTFEWKGHFDLIKFQLQNRVHSFYSLFYFYIQQWHPLWIPSDFKLDHFPFQKLAKLILLGLPHLWLHLGASDQFPINFWPSTSPSPPPPTSSYPSLPLTPSSTTPIHSPSPFHFCFFYLHTVNVICSNLKNHFFLIASVLLFWIQHISGRAYYSTTS